MDQAIAASAPDVLLFIRWCGWEEFGAGHTRLGIVCGERLEYIFNLLATDFFFLILAHPVFKT